MRKEGGMIELAVIAGGVLASGGLVALGLRRWGGRSDSEAFEREMTGRQGGEGE
jgi:hypothetical protein